MYDGQASVELVLFFCFLWLISKTNAWNRKPLVCQQQRSAHATRNARVGGYRAGSLASLEAKAKMAFSFPGETGKNDGHTWSYRKSKHIEKPEQINKPLSPQTSRNSRTAS